MKKVFLDTNIIVDVMAQREPFNVFANRILKLGIEGTLNLLASPLTFANCAYILRKHLKGADPMSVVRAYKRYITVTTMDEYQFNKAIYGEFADFEDALQYESALASKCDCIVTRNEKHFPKEVLPIFTPDMFLKHIYAD